ncbi:phage tail tape measure protein [Roseivivax isoporae]|uniref:Lysozyme n=1 Tax=Roseivivax isoporae LMG 25204 TaxID=1449351 RepID=X7F448_9RHOB|nr:phage tail tape measure protein [Roseivivax isoporae]ETX26849.1 hypothetical protein RISW2_18815 [Roseivivax isoporae LMG 25204]
MNGRTRSYSIRLSAEGKRQLEADLRALGVSGERSLRRIQGAARPASAGLQATDRSARELRGSLAAVGRELPALQRLAGFLGTTALAGGIVAFGRASLDVAGQFQAAMKRVEAATLAPADALERLRRAALDTGGSTAFTAREAADAIEILAKNGLGVADILGGALTATVNLAGGLGAELAPAGDLVTDVMQQFGLAASDLPDVVDAITGAALKSKFGFDDLRLAIGQAGGVAGQFGGDYRETLAVISATAAGFASGSDAGTSYKNFLQRLTPQSDQAADAMQRLALEFYNADGSMKSMIEIAGELQDATVALNDEARNSAFQTIFGTDAIRTALLLADQGADGLRDVAAALGDVSAAQQAEVRLRGLEGALKEVAAAWEAMQLASADAGGLDLAEAAVRRLTEALRYVSENFAQVEEVAERVAQALVVFLVGRGVTLAIAKAAAMRAAYIELAGAVTGVGTAASRSVGALTRLGAAARVLTRTLGGPLSLAMTAASVAALAIDFDSTSDAVERADSAAMEAVRALDAFRDASRRAADEQARLGETVSDATRSMLEQSRAQLEQALSDVERTYEAARDSFGRGNLRGLQRQLSVEGSLPGRARSELEAMLFPRDAANGFMQRLESMAQSVRDGRNDVGDLAAEFERLQAAGSVLEGVRDRILDILDSGDRLRDNPALAGFREAAREAGLFEDELAAIAEAASEQQLADAYLELVRALTEATEAGKLLRAEGLSGFRENLDSLVETEDRLDEIRDALQGNLDLAEDIDGRRPFDETADSAEEAAAAVRRLTGAAAEYYRSRELGSEPPAGAEDTLKRISGVADGQEASAILLRFFEGFQATAKMDVNAYRAGYGSDTVTLADGSIRKVVEGMRVSVEDAERDLYRRVGEFQDVVIGQIGAERFDAFTGSQKAALTSIAYNYGELPGRILGPVRGGSDADIAAAIRSLQGDNDGINARRRRTEAAVFGRGLGVDAGVEAAAAARKAAAEDAAQAAEDRAEAQAREAETLQRLVAIGDEQIAQLQLETELTGKSAAEQVRLRTMFELLTAAKQAGIDPERQLTEDGRRLIDVYREQAAAIAARTTAQEQSQAASDAERARFEESKGAVRSAFEELKPGGGGITAFWDSLLGHIGDKLWQLALDPVWDILARLLDDVLGGFGAGVGAPAPAAVPSRASGGGLDRYAGGGRIAERAAGLLSGAGGKRQDNLLFWGSRGEFMQPAAAVDYYGADFMEAVRQRRFPRLADGGSLGGMPAVPTGPRGGAPVVNVPVTVRNESGAQVSAERNPQGGIDVHVTDRMIDDYFARGRGDGALRRRFGMRARPQGA